MKLSERIFSPLPLLWLYPLLLIVPNVWLSVSEQYTIWSKLTNIILPLGIWYLMMGIWRRTGLTVLLSLPVAILCAFQIVLLYLYGESIIAIDMFMNVATTNFSEATELLRNLWEAIATVLLLYLPPLALGVWLCAKKRFAADVQLRCVRISGATLTVIGAIFALVAGTADSGYRISRELFPLNVTCNLCNAVKRIQCAKSYYRSSQGFSHNAFSTRQNTVQEVYVLVIGETSRADNWQLLGYDRPTNPRLSQRKGLLAYPCALSESNTTHKSVPMLLSNLRADNFGDSVYRVTGIFDAFNQAGTQTVFLTNQAPNGSYIDYFAAQARQSRRICSDGAHHYDHELLDPLAQCLDTCRSKRLMVVLHTYGSHYSYHERYTPDCSQFKPDGATVATPENRSDLINAYDNSIVYTDALLDSIIGLLDKSDRRAVMVYTSDHGEDIFDDGRERFLHASPTPTYWQLHVPFLIWMSASYRQAYPELYSQAARNCNLQVSSTASVFDTMLDLAGITASTHHPDQSLCSSAYREPQHIYLNDYNEGVDLTHSGLREPDFRMLRKCIDRYSSPGRP